MKILVTGGGGYAGTPLVSRLLEAGFGVRVLDPLLRGGIRPLLPLFRNREFDLMREDMTDSGVIEKALSGMDAIIHLAAVVGHPACDRDPERTEALNILATKKLCGLTKGRPFIFASTGSCYGVIPRGQCTEKTPLNPVSLYGTSKVTGEETVLSETGGVVLRFATAFGLSPVMRTDLLLNNLILQAVRTRSLTIFEPEARRTFIHVNDMADSFLFALENYDRMANKAWNVGTEEQNLSKREICFLISNNIPGLNIDYGGEGSDPDARDYSVSYRKITDAGFKTSVSIMDGIQELVRGLTFWEYN